MNIKQLKQIFQRLLGPTASCWVLRKIRREMEEMEQREPITRRTCLEEFEPFVSRDVHPQLIKTYTNKKAFRITWNAYKNTAYCKAQIELLQEYIPTFNKQNLKQGAQGIHCDKKNGNTVFLQQENRSILYDQVALPPPYRYVYLYLLMPTDIDARNKEKTLIYSYYEFFLKDQIKNNSRTITTRDIYDFVDLVESSIINYELNESSLITYRPTNPELSAATRSGETFTETSAAMSATTSAAATSANRALHYSVAINPPATRGSSNRSPAYKFGWLSWSLILLVALIGVLKYYFSGSGPSNLIPSMKREDPKVDS